MTNTKTSLSPPAAILFDLDGTLIDSIDLIVRSHQHATETHLGAPHSREAILPTIGLSLVSEFERIAPGKADDLLQTYRAFFLAKHDELMADYPGVVEMLNALAALRMPLGLVTSKSMISATPSLKRHALRLRMDVVVSHDDTERHKPHPEPLLLAAKRMTLAPNACWYVGDSTHDMEAARAAGMTAIGAAWGPYGREPLVPLADIVLESPGDLIALLDRVSPE